jgi:flagellar operon protein (TIGR03826 family)
MEVKNCKNCGRLFNYLSGPRLCGECRQQLEDKFMEVRNYIMDNPKASIPEISEAMEVSTAQIHQWVREERLIFSADSMVTIECENCGAPIRTGRFCEKCKSNTAHGLESLYKQEAPAAQKKERERDRMRFLDK